MAHTNSSRRRLKQRQQPPRVPRERPQVKRAARHVRSATLFRYVLRLIILGVGASAIAGTAYSIVHPTQPDLSAKIDSPATLAAPTIEDLKLTQSSIPLAQKLAPIVNQNGRLEASYLFCDLESGEYSEVGADRVLPAASTIKLPILIALFQDIDAGKVRPNESLMMTKQLLAEGAGDLQQLPVGTQVSVLAAAHKMMTISDNTATNLIIQRLGGIATLNRRFQSWGLNATKIERLLPDLSGKNTTSARELARMMLSLTVREAPPSGERPLSSPALGIVSENARRQIWEMMSNTEYNTMLPKGLGVGAKIAHKTGDIGFLIADVGTIELPNGKKYLATAIVKRPYNDPAGPNLVRQISKVAYEYFQNSRPQLSAPSTSTDRPNSN